MDHEKCQLHCVEYTQQSNQYMFHLCKFLHTIMMIILITNLKENYYFS